MILAEWPSMTRNHHPNKAHYGGMRISIYRTLMGYMRGEPPGALAPK